MIKVNNYTNIKFSQLKSNLLSEKTLYGVKKYVDN